MSQLGLGKAPVMNLEFLLVMKQDLENLQDHLYHPAHLNLKPLRTPYATKVGKTYVDLKWSLPIFDSGSKITGYIIEGRESGSS